MNEIAFTRHDEVLSFHGISAHELYFFDATIKSPLPKIEERCELWEEWGVIEILPYVRLQNGRVIGEVI